MGTVQINNKFEFMHQETSDNNREVKSLINDRKPLDIKPFNHRPEKDLLQTDILELDRHILSELDDLEKSFDQIFLDILFSISTTSDFLKSNQSYQELNELLLKIKEQQKKLKNQKKTLDHGNFIFERPDDYYGLFNLEIQDYQSNLKEYQENYERLTQEIAIKEQEIESLKITARKIESLKVKKMEVDTTSSLAERDVVNTIVKDCFLKIAESREKLNKLKSDLENFCQQQSYQDLAKTSNLNSATNQKKLILVEKIKEHQKIINQNLTTVDLYKDQLLRLKKYQLHDQYYNSLEMIKKLGFFCSELDTFINFKSLDKFKTELQSLLSSSIEINDNSKKPALSPIPEEHESTESTSTNNSQEIETVNPEKLFQEVLKNLLDEEQKKANSIIVLGQEVSRSCSLFDKLKCFSPKGFDEDEQPAISYFLIKNKLVKLIYNSQDLIISSESNSRNLTHLGEDQSTNFSSEEILKKLSELADLKLRFTASRAFEHIDSPQNSSQELSQNILKNITIEIVEIEDLSENRSIPKSIKDEANKLIKKEANKLQQTTPEVTVSIGCFQALSPKNEKVVAV
jgi:hypothetical protein